MLNHFKMPNDIFSLTATECAVLSALYSVHSTFFINGSTRRCLCIKQAKIAEKCGLSSIAAVRKAIKSLCNKGFLRIIRRNLKRDGNLGTFSYSLPVLTKGYFFVPRHVMGKLRPSAMKAYLFICKSIQSVKRFAWNSYTDIAEKLGCSRVTAIRLIRQLADMKLIVKSKIRKEDGSYSDNHYRLSDDTEQISEPTPDNLVLNSTSTIICSDDFSFISWGSIKKRLSLIVPTTFLQKKEIINYIHNTSYIIYIKQYDFSTYDMK